MILWVAFAVPLLVPMTYFLWWHYVRTKPSSVDPVVISNVMFMTLVVVELILFAIGWLFSLV